MYFESISELITMAGHGKYVWSCVTISTFVLALVFINASKHFNKQLKLNTKLNNLP